MFRKHMLVAILISCMVIVVSSCVSAAQPVPPSVPKEADPGFAGDWIGTLDIGMSIRIVFIIKLNPQAPSGYEGYCLSPDQSSAQFPISSIELDGTSLAISVASVDARYQGSFFGPDTITGKFLQGSVSLPLTLQRKEWKIAKRPQDPVAPFPYRDEEVTVPRGSFSLAGTLSLPDDTKLADATMRFPAVILISGSGLQNRDEEILNHRPFLVLADSLARKGIAVLRLDDRGTGESTGDPSMATTLDFAADTLAAVNYLKTRADIDPARIGLCGHSEGGLIAFILAAEHPSDIAFIVSMAGPGMKGDELLVLQGKLIAKAEGVPESEIQQNTDIQRKLLSIVKEHASDDNCTAMNEEARSLLASAGVATDAIESALAEINAPWMRWFVACDPAVYIAQLRCPVLALNGELDLQVPFEQNLKIIREQLTEAGNTRSLVRSYPGLNHLFQHAKTGSPSEYGSIEETIAEQVLLDIQDWIVRNAPGQAKKP